MGQNYLRKTAITGLLATQQATFFCTLSDDALLYAVLTLMMKNTPVL
jgi:hypothetical protein